MKNDLKSKALRGFGWIFGGTLGQSFLQFVSLIFLARLLTPDEFGVVSIALVVIGFLKIFTELGVGPAVVQRVNLTVDHIKTANTISIILGIMVALGLYMSAESISDFFEMPDLILVIQMLSLIIPLSALTVVGQSLLQRELQFKKISAYGVISFFVGYTCVAIPLALANFGVWSLVLAQISQIVVMVFIIRFSVRESSLYGFCFKSAKDLLSFGFGFSLAKISNFFASEGDNLIVGKFLNAAALGIYSNAYRLMSFPAMLIGGVIDKVLFPIFSSIQEDKERLARSYVKLLSFSIMLIMPISIYLYFFSSEIIFLLLGEQWGEAVVVFQILIMVLVFRLNYKFSDLLARAVGAVYRRAARQLIYAFAVLIGGYVGHFYDVTGVAVGVGFAIFVNYLLMLHLSQILIGFSWISILIIHVKQMVVIVPLVAVGFLFRYFFISESISDFLILIMSGFVFLLSTFFLWVVFSRLLREELDLFKFVYIKLFVR